MNNSSRRTSMTYPNGRVVNIGYGSAGSIDDLFSLVNAAAISGESGNKVEYSRAGLGRFVKIAYPQPGVEMSMIRPGGGSEGDSGDPYDGYDRFGRVQEMRWQNASTGTPIDAWQWGYNEASNRTWKKNLVATSGQDEAYGYDGLSQVIRDAVGTMNTNRTAIGGIPGEEEDFTYDPTGNWLGYRKDTNGSPVLDQSRSNNKDNQLTQIDGSSALLAYDRAGNATKVPPGTNGDWSKCYQPVWDAWGRIVEVKDENGDTVQKNAYDGLTRRITKEAASVVTHTYWSDRWKPLEERTGSATTAARSYLWGERPGHRDELVLRDRDTDGNGTLDERLYATMDYFNGTAVLNTSGVVQERYAYSAFGVRRIMAADFSPRSTSSYAWPFGFQGQFRDNETGWSNYGYRFYVPLLGRWINRDPLGEDGGENLYGFTGNSPVRAVDFLGLIDTSFAPANTDPGYSWGTPTIPWWLGWTSYEHSCSCTCNSCIITCDTSLTATITLNKDYYGSVRMNGIYGHEQAHIVSRNSEIQAAVDITIKIKQQSKTDDACKREAITTDDRLCGAVRRILNKKDHTGDNFAQPNSPPPGTEVPPIKGSRNMPPDLPFSLYGTRRRG